MNDKRYVLDEATIKILFKKYKIFIIPSGIIFVVVALFLTLVMPQVDELFSMDVEAKATRERIKTIKNNIQLLASQNEQEQNLNAQIVVSALPLQKDYIGIISAVSAASIKSGVSVGDFSFSVGDISSSPSVSSGNMSFKIGLNVVGSTSETRRFLRELSRSLPLSEIENLDISDNAVRVAVVFFYKSMPPVNINYVNPLQSLSKKELELLKEITTWKLDQAVSF